jgi:hypothetical protein
MVKLMEGCMNVRLDDVTTLRKNRPRSHRVRRFIHHANADFLWTHGLVLHLQINNVKTYITMICVKSYDNMLICINRMDVANKKNQVVHMN